MTESLYPDRAAVVRGLKALQEKFDRPLQVFLWDRNQERVELIRRALEYVESPGLRLSEMVGDPDFKQGFADGRAGRPLQNAGRMYHEGYEQGMLRRHR